MNETSTLNGLWNMRALLKLTRRQVEAWRDHAAARTERAEGWGRTPPIRKARPQEKESWARDLPRERVQRPERVVKRWNPL